MKIEYCVYCDKRLSTAESQALTAEERKYYFILCSKHLKERRAEEATSYLKYDSSEEDYSQEA